MMAFGIQKDIEEKEKAEKEILQEKQALLMYSLKATFKADTNTDDKTHLVSKHIKDNIALEK